MRWNMKYSLMWLTLFALFVAEGAIFPWLVPPGWEMRISPHFVLVVLLFISLYKSRHLALALGLLFGFMHDLLYYGYMIGLYSFATGLTCYLIGLVFQRARLNFINTVLIIGLGDAFYSSVVFGLYRLFNVRIESYSWIFTEYILPSLLMNLFIALVIYIPCRQLMDRLKAKAAKEEA